MSVVKYSLMLYKMCTVRSAHIYIHTYIYTKNNHYIWYKQQIVIDRYRFGSSGISNRLCRPPYSICIIDDYWRCERFVSVSDYYYLYPDIINDCTPVHEDLYHMEVAFLSSHIECGPPTLSETQTQTQTQSEIYFYTTTTTIFVNVYKTHIYIHTEIHTCIHTFIYSKNIQGNHIDVKYWRVLIISLLWSERWCLLLYRRAKSPL